MTEYFKCDFCGTFYPTQKLCQECETGHLYAEIEKYEPVYVDPITDTSHRPAYPECILVHFKNGASKRYNQEKEKRI